MSRFFHGTLFFGMGEHSIELHRLLQLRFDDAVSHASGMQQGGYPEEMERGEREIKAAIEDIAAALLGCKVTFGDALPYPPVPQNGTEVTTTRLK